MSGEETKAVTEIAKAVGEIAKTSGKVVDASAGFGNWFSKTIGTIPEGLLGIAGGDWLHEKRKRNLFSLQAKTAEIRMRINAGPPQEPSVSVVLPLLKAASDEARPELQELWAGLLASSFQPDGGQRVRRAFFDTLQNLEPPDALLFDVVVRHTQSVGSNRFDMIRVAYEKGITGNDLIVSIEALERLKLVHSPYGDQSRSVTPYGMTFWEACNPQSICSAH